MPAQCQAGVGFPTCRTLQLGADRRRPAAAFSAVRRRSLAALRAVCASAVQDGRLDAQVAVVLGTQWGDEGKGKLVDILAQQYDIVARAQVCMCTFSSLFVCTDLCGTTAYSLRWCRSEVSHEASGCLSCTQV